MFQTWNLGHVLVPLFSGRELGDWIAKPQSWYGLHTVFAYSLDVPIAAIFMFFGAYDIQQAEKELSKEIQGFIKKPEDL